MNSEQSGGDLGARFHGPSAAPVLALTSVKQPLPWSPVAERTKSRSLLLVSILVQLDPNTHGQRG